MERGNNTAAALREEREKRMRTRTLQNTSTVTAEQIIAAIGSGLAAGADETNWEAPEFAEAVRLTGEAGCEWEFDGWKATRRALEGYRALGGVQF